MCGHIPYWRRPCQVGAGGTNGVSSLPWSLPLRRTSFRMPAFLLYAQRGEHALGALQPEKATTMSHAGVEPRTSKAKPNRDAKSRRASATLPGSQPIYMRVAGDLTERIAKGRYPVGSNLPKEVDLSVEYGISRFTMRAAFKLLREAGLISRRKRAGTQVVATAPVHGYSQPTNSINDILQYAEGTRVVIRRCARVRCSSTLANLIGCAEGKEWLRVDLIRTLPASDIPICISTTYLNLDLPRIAEYVSQVTGPISAMLESQYKLRISLIEQVIEAVRVGKGDARILKTESGGPALRTIRRYHDEQRRIVELSVAIHPGERFSYVGRYERD